MQKNGAIIQARMGSTRFPGKVLRRLGSEGLLGWIVHRLRMSQELNDIIVATSQCRQDDPVDQFCREYDVKCYRGSEDDVLGRFVGAAEAFDIANIIRVNGDNPLIDPDYLDILLGEWKSFGGDYLSFRVRRSTPVMLRANKLLRRSDNARMPFCRLGYNCRNA